MEKVNYHELKSRCDVCEIAEHYSPISGCWTGEDQRDFCVVFKELDREGLKCQHFIDLVFSFDKGGMLVFVSEPY